MPDLNLKIGLVAPSKGGKTTLLAATFYEIKKILVGNEDGAGFFAHDKKTFDAIQQKIGEYKAVVASNAKFDTTAMPGTSGVADYQFTLSVPSGQGYLCQHIQFKDFEGGIIGTQKFQAEVEPFLGEADAIIVPIASDFVVAWFESCGSVDPVMLKKNAAANKSLQTDDIRNILADWVIKRVRAGKHPYIAFAPIRCESYFDDNGGVRDESMELFEAVRVCFVKPLFNLLNEKKVQVDSLAIEIHAIDTYGVVDLVSTEVYESSEGISQLESTFVRRLNAKDKCDCFASKGAFATLTRVLNYQMTDISKGLGITQNDLETKIAKRGRIRAWILEHFPSLDKEKKDLLNLVTENEKLVKCIATFGKIAPPDPVRQRIVCDNGERLQAP